MFTSYSHFSLPVASASAYTLASWSCRYTTPPVTTGAAVNEPAYDTAAAASPASSNAQVSRSCDTFADEITEPGASLVLASSPFGYGHCPEGDAVPGNLVVSEAALLPPPPAAAGIVTEARRAAGSSKYAPKGARR